MTASSPTIRARAAPARGVSVLSAKFHIRVTFQQFWATQPRSYVRIEFIHLRYESVGFLKEISKISSVPTRSTRNGPKRREIRWLLGGCARDSNFRTTTKYVIHQRLEMSRSEASVAQQEAKIEGHTCSKKELGKRRVYRKRKKRHGFRPLDRDEHVALW